MRPVVVRVPIARSIDIVCRSLCIFGNHFWKSEIHNKDEQEAPSIVVEGAVKTQTELCVSSLAS